jgi:hypothetical protein
VERITHKNPRQEFTALETATSMASMGDGNERRDMHRVLAVSSYPHGSAAVQGIYSTDLSLLSAA